MDRASVQPKKMEAEPYIVFGKPVIGEREIVAVTRTLQTSWIGTGPRVHEFQASFAEYVQAKHAIATSSCTAALHLAMMASGIGAGDEVITTPMTFCATANAILHTGAVPIFADCEPGTMNIDPEAVEAAITPRTRAILPVHFAGRPANLDALGALAKKHGLLLIEDAAHAIETSYHGRKIGGVGDITCFSFYVTKNMTTGEGGMLTTQDAKLAERIRTYALHGLSADAWSRFSDKGYKHYDVVFPGFKYNLTDVAASLGLAQLPKLPEWLERREAIWARYDHAFTGLPVALPPLAEPGTQHARHLYTLLILDQAPLTRDRFMMEMHERRVGTGVHYRALHTHQFYRQRFGYVPEQLPRANFIGERTVSLPLSPLLTDAEVERVIAATRSLLAS